MRFLKTVLLLVWFTVPIIAIAQTKSTATKNEVIKGETTKVEEFLSKKGQLIVKDFYTVDTYKDKYTQTAVVEAIVFTNPLAKNVKVKGLKLEYNSISRSEEKQTCFMDVDEIEAVIQSIDYIITLATEYSSITKPYTEIKYETKGNFAIGFFQENLKQTFYSSIGNYSKVSIYMQGIEDLNKFKATLVAGNNLLKDK